MDLFNPEVTTPPPPDAAIVPAAPLTEAPTEPPTRKPTASPTLEPTRGPTLAPTASPTDVPSASRLPTLPPTLRPSYSASPSDRPTAGPSISGPPTASPSGSSAPSADESHAGMEVTLTGVRALEDLSDWEEYTARYYQGVYDGDGGSVLEDAVVRIRLTGQNTIDGGGGGRRRRAEGSSPWRRTRGRTLRWLQEEAPAATTSVVVTYTQSTTYRGRDPGLDDADLLRLPLSTEEYRENYVAGLKRDLEGYEDLAGVSGVSTPYDGTAGGADGAAADGTNDASAGGGGMSAALVLGIACGGAAFLLLAGGIAYYRRARREGEEAEDDDGEGRGTRKFGGGREGDGGRRGDDAEGGALGDMSVASGDWRPDDDLLDDAEELRTVYAPAGKLGLTLDSPDGGAPVIHEVKETSPVAEEVRAGDRLVAVDGEDVRAMTAIKVSRLISKKSASARKLVVVRHVGS